MRSEYFNNPPRVLHSSIPEQTVTGKYIPDQIINKIFKQIIAEKNSDEIQ